MQQKAYLCGIIGLYFIRNRFRGQNTLIYPKFYQ